MCSSGSELAKRAEEKKEGVEKWKRNDFTLLISAKERTRTDW
jgi:hypothetical protein